MKVEQTGKVKWAEDVPTTLMSVPYAQNGIRAEGINLSIVPSKCTGCVLRDRSEKIYV